MNIINIPLPNDNNKLLSKPILNIKNIGAIIINNIANTIAILEILREKLDFV
jgi:hypothetical protein